MTDATGDKSNVLNVLLGCDPQVNVRITETPSGTLFVSLEPADPSMPIGDLDGVFFDLADDSTLGALNFSPAANDGTIFSPVTAIQAAVDAVDTLSNGAQVAESYDVGIQFGTVDSSTEGQVSQANFTLWSDNGPLKIADLDTDSFAAVVDSDGGNGQVLTTSDKATDDPVLVDKEVLFEDFDDIHRPEDSDAVQSSDGWDVRYDKLYTDGHNDGTVTLEEVQTDGPVSLTLDLSTHNTHVFENSGQYADSLRIEVNIDGEGWVLLDEYQVNDAGTALVGSETGQSFDTSGATVTYSGGILDDATDSAQFRVISDISAGNEVIKIDNVSVTASEVSSGGTQVTESTLVSEDFEGIHDPDDSAAILSDARWDVREGELATDGCNDGTLTFAPVQAEGDVSLCFDARVGDASRFEATGHYADELTLQVQLADGAWQTLDSFVVNSEGTALVGSETGNQITEDGSTLNYSGGILDGIDGEVQFRLISDISASNEQVFFDNFEIKETSETEGDDCPSITLDFEGVQAGDVISTQFAGVTVSAQRDGDSEGSENDAMIFDSTNPTGGDHDLEYADQGNILIISEDNDSDDPDDEAHGGTFTFEFDEPARVESLNLLDIEESGGTIDLFDADGVLLQSLAIPAAGDNSAQDLAIDTDNVSTMNVNLVGSGAVDDLVFTPQCDCPCDGQYDVGYIAGVPILELVDDEKLGAPEEAEELEDMII